ncbi:MAG: hypothetical protein KBG83_01950 [Bacteroidetes bacterium]|nr:hypothetical protein [Bacteroidota bacterium]
MKKQYQLCNVLILLVISAACVLGQTSDSAFQQKTKSSRLKPVSESELLQRQQLSIAQTNPKDTATYKKPLRKKRNVAIQKELANQTALSLNSETIETKPQEVKPQEEMVNKAESRVSPFLLLGIVFVLAVINVLAVMLYLQWKKTRMQKPLQNKLTIPKNVEKLRNSESEETSTANNFHHLAEYRLHDEAEMDSTIEENERPPSEVELAQALRQLKSKYQAMELGKVVLKKTGKKQKPEVAKKLGTGIGEIELATRLEQMKKIQSKREKV